MKYFIRSVLPKVGEYQEYVEENLQCLDLSKYPKSLTIRILTKEYIVLLKKVNNEFVKELEPKLQEAIERLDVSLSKFGRE